MARSFYDLLGVAPDASVAAIDTAYRGRSAAAAKSGDADAVARARQHLDTAYRVLRNAIAHQTIVSTTEISISTQVVAPVLAGGGVDNIAFLVNTGADSAGPPTGPNAKTALMTATFWLETVERDRPVRRAISAREIFP